MSEASHLDFWRPHGLGGNTSFEIPKDLQLSPYSRVSQFREMTKPEIGRVASSGRENMWIYHTRARTSRMTILKSKIRWVLWNLDFGQWWFLRLPGLKFLDFSNDCCILVDMSTSQSKVLKIPFPKWSNGFQMLGLLLGLPRESYFWKCSDFISALKNL